jgi:hypothetical protein
MDRFLTSAASHEDIILAPQSINSSASDPPNPVETFKLYGKQYIRCGALTKNPKATRQRSSPIWKWGEDIQLMNSDGKTTYFYCYLCERQKRKQELMVVSTGRCTALDHLEEDHKMNRITGELHSHTTPAANQPTIESYPAQRMLDLQRNFEAFKQLLIRWIVCCHIAFFQIENIYFRELLFFLYPGLEKILPKAASTIRGWVTAAFEQRKEDLRKEMHEAHSAISISFDLWTSPNAHAVLGVIAHFINKCGRRRKVVLGLREVIGEHSGENQAAVLVALFNEYKIKGNIGWFMADNAESNDVCIDKVLRALYPNMSAKQRKARRLRCFGHIVNLCAQAFIVGKDAEKVCKKLATAYRDNDMKTVEKLWRDRGAVGLLHNIVRYIRMTPQRRGFFRRIQMGGSLAEFDALEVSSS